MYYQFSQILFFLYFFSNFESLWSICPLNCDTCLSYSQETCTKCSSTYFLTGDSKCCKGQDCASCKSDYSRCETCPTKFFLNSINCSPCLQNCDTCLDATTCSECSPTFYKIVVGEKTTCVSCMDKCNKCSDETTCTECIFGYYYDSESKQCKACPEGCGKCTSDGTCSQCISTRFYFQEGKCKPCENNCVTCLNTLECTSCGEKYWLDGSKCSPCSPHCKTCANNYNCSLCDDETYFIDAKTSTCILCSYALPNCTTCSAYGKNCLSCVDKSFYKKVDSGGCQSCSIPLPNCAECSDNTSCTTCNEKFFVKAGLCAPCGANCRRCVNENKCTTCLDGFYTDSNGICKPCIVRCKTCSNGESCDVCIDGFYKNGLVCSGCPEKCLKCSSSSNCQICNQTYFPDDTGTCKSCAVNCLECKDASTCTKCADGYFVENNVCKECSKAIDNCFSCSSNLICNKCINNTFYLNQKKQCSTCSEIPNCKSCSTYETCIDCKNKNFFLNSSSQCATCDSVLQKCTDCNDSSTCIACQSEYYVNFVDKKCAKCESAGFNCKTCDDKNLCKSCISGPFYYNSTEKSCPDCGLGCKACTKKTDCTECYNDFMTVKKNDQSYCSKCDSTNELGCKKCSTVDTCSECNEGYVLNGKNCELCQSPCLKCDTSKTTCKTCVIGYILSGTSCNPLDCTPNKEKPLFSIQNLTCTDCIGENEIKINDTFCGNKPTPVATSDVVNNFDLVINYDCGGIPSKVILAYSLGNYIEDLSVTSIKSKVVDSSKTSQEKVNWLHVEDFWSEKSGKGSYKIKNVKNSGETFSLRILCEVSILIFSSPNILLFTSQDNGAKSIVVSIAATGVLSGTQKMKVASNLASILNLQNPIYTDEGKLANTYSYRRNMQEGNSNIFKLYIVPNYKLKIPDPNLIGLASNINNYPSLTSLITNGLPGVIFINIVATEERTIGDDPSLIVKYPQFITTQTTLSVPLKLKGSGKIFLWWVKINSGNETYVNTTISYDDLIGLQGYNGTSVSVSAGVEKTIVANGLQEGFYQLYYYGENNGIPRIRSMVYGQICATNGTESDYADILKNRFLYIVIVFFVGMIGLLN